MDDALFEFLRSVDTPTVCNAIETAQGKRGFSAFSLSRSPPGSTSAALLVSVHQISEQFCCSGVTGRIAAFMGEVLGSVMGRMWPQLSDDATCQALAAR